jgi:predicted amidohydrolase
MQDLKVALIQSNIVWENIPANLSAFSEKLSMIRHQPNLIVLPEMFSTGFTMNVEKCAKTISGSALAWMKEQAKALNSIVAGSLLIADKGKYFNRMFWVRPDGSFQFYNKRHLFSMANEQQKISQGKNKTITALNGWNFSLQICYDLRFPVWSKNNLTNGTFDYDVLVYVANWPEIRSHAYKSLLIARAIENQCYVIWVNRVGYDNNRIFHSGDSMVIDPAGKIIAQAAPGKEEMLSVTFSGEALIDFRDKFGFSADWDKFTIQI